MKAILSRVAATVVLSVATALPLRADPPSLASYTTLDRIFTASVGMSTFDIQFLFGRGTNQNTLFYTVGNSISGASTWTSILTTNNPLIGAPFPGQINNPNPGTLFAGISLGGLIAAPTEVRFAICQGVFSGSTSNLATTCSGGNGPFTTGPVAPSVRVLTRTQWNTTVLPAIAPDGAAANANLNTVFGFEDLPLNASDLDYNDVVFATNIAVVPEPSTYALMAAGLAALYAVSRRRKNIHA